MFTGLSVGKRQALADMQDTPVAVDDEHLPPEDTTTDNLDLDSLSQRTKGNTAFFEQLCETLHPLCVYQFHLSHQPSQLLTQSISLVQDINATSGYGDSA